MFRNTLGCATASIGGEGGAIAIKRCCSRGYGLESHARAPMALCARGAARGVRVVVRSQRRCMSEIIENSSVQKCGRVRFICSLSRAQ